ncbi:hypothetical protein SAMN06269185_0012 [Natronoarchaeum philippinense]|uniref:DUF7350 domain-containing protein n=1 Tax=Natronoarchaeum philippinense TaxID=558529 RepID=A0A285MZ71_NATPI|nr:hypothetical protein [Natronoarchaeum philippinense]SNZ02398.1 hypothetical protein SAMN06269185_0012 [Natronoarchaeum philippinense]
MHRRDALKAGAAIGGLGITGCLDQVETESVWRNTPLVENRPKAVYLPASREQMATYGRARTGRYAVALRYSFPHRFWTVSGTSTSKVEVGQSDSLHLMATVWDAETGVVLPVTPRLELRHDGSVITSRTLWTMLSQRMGFHYGDNVELDGEGSYVADIRLSPIDATPVGELAGSFEEAASVSIEFEYSPDDIYDLEYTQIDEERRGTRGALPLMTHGGHESSGDAASPVQTVPAAEDLPGELIGVGTSGDAAFAAALVPSGSRFAEQEEFLLVSPRTPYNSIPVPQMGLSATVTRNGETVFDGPLSAAVDGTVGLHYGAAVDELQRGDRVTVSVDTPPQASRHDGYETAFFGMSSMEFTVGE